MGRIDREPFRTDGSPWSIIAAAKFLGLSERHLVRLVDAGWLLDIRFGRRRMIADSELHRFASEGCRAKAGSNATK